MDDRKKTKSQLISELEELRQLNIEFESEKKQKNHLEQIWNTYLHSHIPTLILTKDGEIIKYNNAMKKLTGYSHKEVPDLDNWMPKIYPDEEYRNRVIEIAKESIERKTEVFKQEFIITKKNGEKRVVEFYVHDIICNYKCDTQIIQGIDITEQKRIEKQLRESETRFRTAFENIPDVIVIYDTDLKIRYINEATIQLTNRPLSDYIGKKDEEIWPPEIYQSYINQLKGVLKTKKSCVVETEIILKGGKKSSLVISIIPLLDDKGNVREIMGITHDITEIVSSEEEILNLSKFPAENPSPVLRLNYDGKILYYNEAVSKLLRKNKLSKKQIYKILPDNLKNLIKKALETGEAMSYLEVKVESQIFSYNLVPVIDFQYINLYGIDDTDRKKAEEEVIDNSKRFDAWKASNFIGVIVSNSDGAIIDANDRFLSFTGYSRKELLDGKLDWSELTPREFSYLDAKALEEVAVKGYCTPFEKEYFHKDGHRIPILFGGSQYKEDPDEFIVFIVDLTEQKKIEEEVISLSKFPAENPSPVLRFNPDGEVLYFNEAVSKLLRKNKLSKKQIYKILPDNLKKLIKKALKTGEAMSFLEAMIDSETFSYNLVPIIDFQYVNLYGRNVTDRRKMQIKLRDSINALEEAQSLSKIGSWEYDIETEKTTWSKEMFILFGVDPKKGEPHFKTLMKKIHPDDRYGFLKAVNTIVTNGIPYDREYRIVRSKSDIVWCHTIGNAVKNENGKIVSLFGTAQDITERKMFEHALQQSESILNQTGLLAKIGGWVLDLETGDGIWTKALYEILEFDPKSKPPKVEELLNYYPPDDRKILADAIDKLVKDGAPYDIELQGFTANKRLIWCHINGEPVYEKGKIVKIRGTYQDITERKIYELALRESESILNETGRLAKIGGWVLDLETGGAVWTKSLYEILEFDPKSPPPGVNEHSSYYPPDDRKILTDAINKLLEDGSPFDIEVQGFTANKRLIWCHINGVPVYEKGKIVKIRGTLQDISERKRIELSLIESEERFNLAMLATDDGLYDLNLDTNEIYFSPGWKKMLGYKDNELANDLSVWEKLTEPEDVKKSLIMLNECIDKKREKFQLEFQMMHKDGYWIDVLSRAKVLFDENGKAFRVIGTHKDITERKHAERELKKSRHYYLSLLNQLHEHVIVIDYDYKITDVNNSFLIDNGHTREEVIGRPCYKITLGYNEPCHERNENCRLRDVFETGKTYRSFHSRKRNDGTEINVDIIYSPLTDRDDKIIGVIESVRDITEWKKAEEKLAISFKAMETSLAEKEVLLNEIHHRVKNNLAIIASLLLSQVDRIQDEEYLDIFNKSINRVNSMAQIHEILYRSGDLAHIDFKEYIEKISTKIINIFSSNIGKISQNNMIDNVYLNLDNAIPCGLIINELLSNSYKHAFPDRRDGEISIFMKETKNKTIELIFSDNGIGIPDDFNWKETDSYGLRLVNILVRQLEGTISYKRENGVKFVITFPKGDL